MCWKLVFTESKHTYENKKNTIRRIEITQNKIKGVIMMKISISLNKRKIKNILIEYESW